jgi:quercetin dioxygenase-like cupin family protein
MMAQAFEVWEDPETQARFCFSHSDKNVTTGVMILRPGTELPKHNRPLAFENLLQISGKCQMSLFGEAGELQATHELAPGDYLHMAKGQWHMHANPFDEESATLFKAEGDITKVVEKLRETFKSVILQGVKS